MMEALLVIPAIKKNAVIPDQLIKKLNSITLIQRAIDTALEITHREHILVVTDSEELSLICERNRIKFYLDNTLRLQSKTILEDLQSLLNKYAVHYKNIILYHANTPLVGSDIVKSAYEKFLEDRSKTVISVKQDSQSIYRWNSSCLELIAFENNDHIYDEIEAFNILSFTSFMNDERCNVPFLLPHEKSIEIKSYQDWWVCEKILQQKRIVFNVVGSTEIGMGHIYHSLSLAHEITDHEVIFVCDEKYKVVVDKIAATDYKVIPAHNLEEMILSLKPDMVVNDVLNTNAAFIKTLQGNNIKVVNFEDLGSGAFSADLVINELYDEPQCEGENFRWGYEYLTLRDEFDEAIPHKYEEKVDAILITFGGTDQNNLTMVSLQAILETVESLQIKIYIVCGSGYLFKKELEKYLDELDYKNIELTYAIGVISKIMEKTKIAISSNGRTVYELSDMNIPSIVVSHHERENTHTFASLEKGFANLGVYNPEKTSERIRKSFEKLVLDGEYRKLLFLNIKKYTFRENKQKVIKHILDIL